MAGVSRLTRRMEAVFLKEFLSVTRKPPQKNTNLIKVFAVEILVKQKVMINDECS